MILILSGASCAGKTSVADELASRRMGLVVSARAEIRLLTRSAELSRAELQRFGAELEEATSGRWLADAIMRLGDTGDRLVIVDSVRTVAQATAIRAIGEDAIHVHLIATDPVRTGRFEERAPRVRGEAATLGEAMNHATERGVASLADVADRVIDTSMVRVDEVVHTIERWLEHRGKASTL